MEIQSCENDADGRVKSGAVGDRGVVGGLRRAGEGRIGATDEGDGFRGEFGLDTGFADNEDCAFIGREGEDAGDVDGGGVGRAEDFVLAGGIRRRWSSSEVILAQFLAVEDGGSRLHRWERELNGLLQASGPNERIWGTYHLGWDTHSFELLLVVRSRLRAIVSDEDDLFACHCVLSKAHSRENFGIIEYLYSVTSPASLPYPRRDVPRTTERLPFSFIQPHFVLTISRILRA